ncbi:OLC1v1011335C1 [Oldenlandia corymbosa var. corymbosa]|uniref:OLC1v1011335C1 n=1 Tax=Oldenlandia corymbosa var. corymbosa TaxID=529605 RepID=A0AAV1DWL5_OLDCO|nr:OLC1v1011335C1 [Oldenlandia corymbosa var. corymbosa]
MSSFCRQVLMSLMIICASFQLILGSSFEFQVGDHMGWSVPRSKDTKFYNDWASEKRFKLGDSILFKYRKDSVMEVGEAEYKQCNSTHPIFFSNTGNTVFHLDRSGYFYFISGAAGHCSKGQRMIVKVLGNDPFHPPSSQKSSSSATISSISLAIFSFVLLLPVVASVNFLFLSLCNSYNLF